MLAFHFPYRFASGALAPLALTDFVSLHIAPAVANLPSGFIVAPFHGFSPCFHKQPHGIYFFAVAHAFDPFPVPATHGINLNTNCLFSSWLPFGLPHSLAPSTCPVRPGSFGSPWLRCRFGRQSPGTQCTRQGSRNTATLGLSITRTLAGLPCPDNCHAQMPFHYPTP